MLDLRRLRLLYELHRRGTVGAVAAALDYSPSTVSQQLAVLEREAGTRLFEPAGRRIRLTDAAIVLAGHAAHLLAEVERAEADLAAAAHGPATGVVRVGSFQTATRHLLLPAILALRDSHPGIEVRLVESEPEPGLEALRSHQLDLVIADEWSGAPRPRHGGVDREDLFSEPVRLVLPPAHRARSLAELAEADWATGTAGGGMEVFTRRVCRARGCFEPRIRHRTNELSMLLALVAAGEAVTLLPGLALIGAPPELAVRDVPGLARTVFTAARAGDARRPALAAVRTTIAACAPPPS